MKILFVSMVAFEINSSATIQNKGIIKGLYELNHEIDILTLRPNDKNISFDDSMNDIDSLINKKYYIELDSKYAKFMAKKNETNIFSKETKRKTNIIKFILRKGKTLFKKIFDNISIFDAQKINVKGVAKVDIDYKKYDIIISSSDPKSSHLIVNKIFKDNPKLKVKWIQYWGDPMYSDITRKKDWRNSLVKYYERKLISKCDRVVYASPLTLDIQKEIFHSFVHKMDYASQVYVKEYIFNTKEEINNNIDKINIGYFGAYRSSVRDILPLYNSFKYNKYTLNISGASDLKLTNTDNITIHGMLTYKETLEMEKNSDVLVCICNSSGTQIPGKIYYCTGYNKPIIVILDSEYKEDLRDYLGSFNRFILCENDEDSINSAIEQAKKEIEEKKHYIIDEKLTPIFMAKKILGIIE